MYMTEEFTHGENDYVSLQVATAYLKKKYNIAYNTVRKLALERKFEYKRPGVGAKSPILVRWGSILRWEERITVTAQEEEER